MKHIYKATTCLGDRATMNPSNRETKASGYGELRCSAREISVDALGKLMELTILSARIVDLGFNGGNNFPSQR
jgi:hypothetical protein